jgi:preprotein translocase subunit SecE
MAVSMVAKKTQSSSIMDGLVWLLVLALGLAGGYLLYSFESQLSVFRVLLYLVGFALLSYVSSFSSQGKMGVAFLQASWREMQLVVWPEQQEVSRLSLVVVTSVVVVSLLLWFIDSTLTKIFTLMLG